MGKQELLKRYDSFFGQGTSNKLLEAQKKYSSNQYLRINTSRISIFEIIEFLEEHRVKFSQTFLPNAIKIDKSFFSLASSLPSLTGEIYLQDIASQIPVNCIDFSKYKHVKILDMAAAPGSKTTQLADILKTKKINYQIIALEPDIQRAQKLINNVQKQECRNISIYNCKGQEFNQEKNFDVIFLDAPCSGNLVGDKYWLKKRDINGIMKNSNVQKSLLEKAYSLLKKGGILVYSTCSLEPEENEDNVKWFSNKFNVENIKPSLKIPFSTKALDNYSLRFMPHISQTQGFFVSCFRKK